MVDIARVRRKARAQKTAPRSEAVAERSVPAEAAKPLPTPAETPSAPSSTARVEVSTSLVAEPVIQSERMPSEGPPVSPGQILARLLKGVPTQGRVLLRSSAEAVEPTEALLVFPLAGEWYAVPLASVQYVGSLRWVQSVEGKVTAAAESVEVFTRVPGAPPEVRGIMSLRGRMVLVYDPYCRLGLPVPDTTRAWVLVLQDGDDQVGFFIERGAYVYRVLPEAISPPPFHLPSEKADLLRGIVQHGDRVIGVLDLDRFLALPPSEPPSLAAVRP
jgi:purine-binding chemotaxis protein CheW